MSESTAVNLEADDNIEIEIIDDTPDQDRGRRVAPETTENDEDISAREQEITNYKDDIQKRIKDLSSKAHAERRAKEAAAKERDEAIRYAQQIMAENEALKRYSANNENALINTAKQRAEIQIDALQRKAKEAFEAGETDKFIELQTEIQRAIVEHDKYASYTPRVVEEQPQRQQQAPANTQQHVQQQAAQPDPMALEWYEGNKWFQADGDMESEMTAYAFGVSDILINKRGIDPRSKEYYEEISKSVRKRFPDYEGFKSAAAAREPTPKPATVVAPATRSVSGNRKVVQLTPTQVRLAKRLNLTTEQYAAQLLKEQNQ